MSVVIGIDVGGSTTKIVGFRQNGGKSELIRPLFVRAADPITSLYGAFGKFTTENDLSLSDISRVMTTGIGSTHLTKPIYDLPCESVQEFESIGRGGLYLSGLDEAIVVSLGTGTAVVHAKRGGKVEYLGGTGVGGGTVVGLSRLLLKMDSVEHISALAEEGDLSRIDLRIGDLARKSSLDGMPGEMTASNFGKLSDLATPSDIALGISNMVAETIAMLSVFAARSYGIKNVVLTGNLTSLKSITNTFEGLEEKFGVKFIIPDDSQFATVIGAALCDSAKYLQ